jgi:hypothetical protein
MSAGAAAFAFAALRACARALISALQPDEICNFFSFMHACRAAGSPVFGHSDWSSALQATESGAAAQTGPQIASATLAIINVVLARIVIVFVYLPLTGLRPPCGGHARMWMTWPVVQAGTGHVIQLQQRSSKQNPLLPENIDDALRIFAQKKAKGNLAQCVTGRSTRCHDGEAKI